MRPISKKRAWHKYRNAEWMNDKEFTQEVNALKQEFGEPDE